MTGAEPAKTTFLRLLSIDFLSLVPRDTSGSATRSKTNMDSRDAAASARSARSPRAPRRRRAAVNADEDLRVAQPAPRRRARRARREVRAEEGERDLEDVAAHGPAALDHLAGRAEHDARELAERVLERVARRPHEERLAAAAGAASGAASAAQLPLEDVASLQPRQPDISRTHPYYRFPNW